MRDDEFRVLVAQMRAAQKAYFRERSQDDLKLSKQLERAVDDELKAGDDKQAKLF